MVGADAVRCLIARLARSRRKAPDWRPARIPDRLRRAVVEEAEKELAGLDLETILTAEPPFEEVSDAETQADLERLETAMLLDLLRPTFGNKNRNWSAISLAWKASQVRRLRIERAEEAAGRADRERGAVLSALASGEASHTRTHRKALAGISLPAASPKGPVYLAALLPKSRERQPPARNLAWRDGRAAARLDTCGSY